MADFLSTREELRQHREVSDRLRTEVSTTSYRLRILEQQLRELRRQSSDNNEAYAQKLRETEGKIVSEKENLATRQREFNRAKENSIQAERSFELFIDPRRQLQDHFSNQIPFLLFPLRLETRFKTVGNQHQLWVRVYPDECMIDSFEQLLSKKEVNNAARFWAEYYGAGKFANPLMPEPAIIDLQKAAWRLIVSAHGSGRAAWITQQLIPDAASVFPVRSTDTVILAIVADSWNSADQAIITSLFKLLWLANGNASLVKKAKQDFKDANGGRDPDEIISLYNPVNFDEPLPAGLKREEADLQFAVVIFADLETKSGKEHSWSQPSRVTIMPERLALIRFRNNAAMEPVFGKSIPSPLPTSPDPSPDAGKQFEQTPAGDMIFDESIRWVADFDRAVEIGMGFRLNLAGDDLDGFDKLMVVGVRLGTDEKEGKVQLEALFDHHYFTRKGFGIISQGTPTNNTESADSGFTRRDNSDETFEQYFNKTAGFTHEESKELRSDGQWLAEWLGVNEDIFKKVLNSGGRDQSEAIHMNIALWPATMGYMLDSLMHSAIDSAAVIQARNFFNSNVRGRGPIPTIRIGNQPYGILPTAAFKRLEWISEIDGLYFNANNASSRFLKDLYALLLSIEDHWNKNLLGQVSHITTKSTNAAQILLDILSLHPTSVEFHRRYLESLMELSNAVQLYKPDLRINKNIVDSAMNLLQGTLGYKSAAIPQIAALLGRPSNYAIKHLVDDVPLSESLPVGEYTADHKNYIGALATEALKSADAVRTGEGLTKHPEAELYRLLKFALELGYHTSSLGAAASTGVFNEVNMAAMRTEQPFVHQELTDTITESRYALMYKTVPEISPSKTVSEFIRDSLVLPKVPAFSAYLSDQLKALEVLKNVPTAPLERAFIEHIDCCSYRLDAWKTGIITEELSHMRGNFASVDKGQSKSGIYLGAFGWLENVRPNKNKIVSVKEIPEDLKQDFNPLNDKTYLADSANEGYIHAPSLNQAVTAAVLRNGYISHGKPDGNNVLSVNLTSERIRLALSVIEGIQGGQSLAALLGYNFERTLHDREDLKSIGIDAYIYPLRKKFPLVADKLKETAIQNNPEVDADSVPITAIEARNVVHGVNLANHVKSQTGANRNYPFGISLLHPDPVINKAITEAVNEIIDIADAVADLGIAESVHHVVMGNVDRAAGVLESYSKGSYPQQPEVIRTPRSGATLTHRVAVPFTFIDIALVGTPRAKAEPSVNNWLKDILPPLNKIICVCSYKSRADGLKKDFEVSLSDLGFEPIDLVYAVRAFDKNALNELDDRFLFYLNSNKDPLLDETISLNYTLDSADPSAISIFQLIPLVKSLRSVLVESAPLDSTDLALPNEASGKDAAPPELSVQRVNTLKGDLESVFRNAKAPGGIITALHSLSAPDVVTEAELEAIKGGIDKTLDDFAAFLRELSTYGIQQTGIGMLYTQKQEWYALLKKKVKEFGNRWQRNLSDYATLELLPHDADNLQKMERLVSTHTTPPDLITFAAVSTRKNLFVSKLNSIDIIAHKNYAKLADLVQDIRALNTSIFDLIAIDIDDQLLQIPLFVYNLKARIKTLTDDLETKRIPAVEAILTSIPGLDPVIRAKQVEAAAQIILGDDFKMIPRYALAADQGAEISNSWSATGDLLNYLLTEDGRTNPTEDWLHGIARVHEKMKHLENIILFRSAFDMNEDAFTIHPVQLPFKPEKYHWLAMPFKKEDIDLEKQNTLLYTVFTGAVSATPSEICGVRVDEWTELIPATEETTGISFQFDRPNSEAPQTLLLVTPSVLTGNWQWNDLVDALSYTLEAAKMRAIEPGKIDETAFASFLPAVLGPESIWPYSIVLHNSMHYADKNVITAITNS